MLRSLGWPFCCFLGSSYLMGPGPPVGSYLYGRPNLSCPVHLHLYIQHFVLEIVLVCTISISVFPAHYYTHVNKTFLRITSLININCFQAIFNAYICMANLEMTLKGSTKEKG